MIEEKRILHSIAHNIPAGTIEVLWFDTVTRDGEVIASTPFRRAYCAEDVALFAADVGDSAAAYIAAAGW